MFRVGDKVTYFHKNHKATVIRVLFNGDYTIEFDDKYLIPPQMNVPGNSLALIGDDQAAEDWGRAWAEAFGYQKDSFKNKDTNCPRCGDKWKETIIGRNTFYDCLKCKLKKEDA